MLKEVDVNIVYSAKSKDDRTASLISDMDHLEIAVTKLQEMLERISKYVDNVVAGNAQPNNAIGRYIMDTVSVVPKIDSAAFEKMFNSHLQDLLMVVYLANMTRTQLAVAERLQLLVPNLFTYIVFFFSSYKCLYCVMNTDDFYL